MARSVFFRNSLALINPFTTLYTVDRDSGTSQFLTILPSFFILFMYSDRVFRKVRHNRTQRNTWLRFLTSPAPYRKYRRCHPIQPAVRSMVIVVQSPVTNNISLLGPTQEQPAYGTRTGPDLWAMLATPTLGAIDGLHGTGRTGSTTPGNDSIDNCHNVLNMGKASYYER